MNAILQNYFLLAMFEGFGELIEFLIVPQKLLLLSNSILVPEVSLLDAVLGKSYIVTPQFTFNATVLSICVVGVVVIIMNRNFLKLIWMYSRNRR